jgi:hypothetical protein
MDKRKVERLRRKIAKIRRTGGIRSSELVRLAQQVGRRLHQRGREPTWVSELLPGARPLSIPSHAELNRFTARSILDQLEEDLDMITEQLEARDH